MKKKLFFVISQFYKGGAEMALLNLLNNLSPDDYEVDLLIHDQVYLPGYVNLIDRLPFWVRICNASQGEKQLIAYGKKAFKKIVLRINKTLLSRRKAKRFVKDKHYDIAFNYGEWMPPEYVAKEVQANRKYNWIHNDLDKVDYLDPEVFWAWDKNYDGYIFVSEASLNDSCNAYPRLKNRCFVIHNLCDEQEILRLSREPVEIPELKDKQLLVTVANFRQQKNHLRQLEVMRILVNHGYSVMWLNIGGNVDIRLFNKLKGKIKDYGLEDSYILMESDPNPYKYMALADAVTVLSDYESWSLVITEAKILNVPVIATPTSGALEQLENGINGIITGFSPEEITDAIRKYLGSGDMQVGIRHALSHFFPRQQVLNEWKSLIE